MRRLVSISSTTHAELRAAKSLFKEINHFWVPFDTIVHESLEKYIQYLNTKR